MELYRAVRVMIWLAAAASLGCPTTPDPSDGDADADADVDGDADGDADVASDGDAEADGSVDADIPVEPGPLTMVAEHAAMLVDRVCDLDGDGTLDNSVADLGASAATVTAASLNSIIEGNFEDGARMVYHFPWVDDLNRPSDDGTTMIVYRAISVDDVVDNDFSGSEPFYVHPYHVDPCGEPLCVSEGARLERGVLSAEGGAIPLIFGRLLGRGAVTQGTIGPRGESGEVTVCCHLLIAEAGAAEAPTEVGDATLLEVLAAGGAAYGLPLIPGVEPDMDLDGDGLERLVVDDEGRLETCVDGDLTTIPGRGCWSDPRMADAFSLVLGIRFVGAVHEGLYPDWETYVEGECADPPERSLWDRPDE